MVQIVSFKSHWNLTLRKKQHFFNSIFFKLFGSCSMELCRSSEGLHSIQRQYTKRRLHCIKPKQNQSSKYIYIYAALVNTLFFFFFFSLFLFVLSIIFLFTVVSYTRRFVSSFFIFTLFFFFFVGIFFFVQCLMFLFEKKYITVYKNWKGRIKFIFWKKMVSYYLLSREINFVLFADHVSFCERCDVKKKRN